MKTQEIFIAHPETSEQIKALKAFMQALKIKFEVSKKEGYNPEFVKKILEAEESAQQGNVTRIHNADNIWADIL